VARLVAFLRDSGQLNETLMVFSADHGTMLGSHGVLHKQWPYEESIGIPLVMRYGDCLGTGRVEDLLIGVVDYAPTLLGLLGVPAPDTMQGRDLAAHLVDPGHGGARPGTVYIQEATCADQGARQGMLPWRGVRTRRYTYARDLRGPWLLFDNDADPFQLRNLVADSGAREALEALERELDGWLERTGDLLAPEDEIMAHVGLAAAWAARRAHFRDLRLVTPRR
jgi:arylsulfatase A-like enzyme